MSLNKSKCWYLNNCLHYLKVRCWAVPLDKFNSMVAKTGDHVGVLSLAPWAMV